MARYLGVDLGTSSVVICAKGRGIVLNEPSILCKESSTGKILKAGREAYDMIGRTPNGIETVYPMQSGVINRHGDTLKMLSLFVRRACGSMVTKPVVVICVPVGITEVEERAVVDAAVNAGARKTYLIEEPMAAAIGVGIDICDAAGHMIVDIGGGTTDIAVIARESIVASECLRVAGDDMTEAIVRYLRRHNNLAVGERTANEIKMQIGTITSSEARSMEVRGKCLVEGLPKAVIVTSKEMKEALEEPVTAIAGAVCSVLEKTPPALIDDISKNGIILTGGGSLLVGMDKLIAKATGIETRVAENALECVAVGCGNYLTLKALHNAPLPEVRSATFRRSKR